MNMNRLPVDDRSRGRMARGNEPPLLQTTRRHRPKGCHGSKGITLDTLDLSISCVTEPRRVFGNHIEHRLNIGRRAGDDAKNLARRRLLFQRLGEFLEQPHVLDGDHGLVGEGLEERDLFFGERPQLGAPDRDGANRNALAQKRNSQ